MNNLVRQVAGGVVVRSLTGHVTEAMTDHYSYVGIDEKRTAVRAVLSLIHGPHDAAQAAEGGTPGGTPPAPLDATG